MYRAALTTVGARTAAAIVVLWGLAGCEMIVPPWKLAALREEANRPVTCMAGKDCREKWDRAKQWLKKNAKLPITQQTDTRLETAKSTNLNPDPEFVITQEADGGDRFIIHYEAKCDDGFGCTPALLKLKASFVTSVMEPAE